MRGVSYPVFYVVVQDGTWWHAFARLGGYESDQLLALGAEATLAYVQSTADLRGHRPDQQREPATRARCWTLMPGYC